MMDNLETRVPPLAWLLVSLGTVWLVAQFGERLVPAERGPLLGVIMAVVGVGVAIAGVIDFKFEHTSVDPMDLTKTDTLVTKGVYRITRNPMYLGMLCMILGAGLWLGSFLALLIGAGVFVAVLTRLQIIPEERALREQFGAKYDDYRSSVRRWI